MTREQNYLLDYLEEQRVAAIQGGAGTGKTMLAIEKAKRLAQTDKVLFLCFNKFLLKSLKEKYANDNVNIDFYNLPALFYHSRGMSNIDGNEGISEFLLSTDTKNWKYSHIIIDEGQDFFEDHIILLETIAEKSNGCFYVFYDKNQLVQQIQTPDWLKEVECRLILSANCRNTKSIAITSNKAIGINEVKMRLDMLGDKPKLYITHSSEDALEQLSKSIRYYTDNGIKKRDIVILTVKTEENSILSGISSIGSYHLTSDADSNDILFTSARKFKGLEANVIIIIDMDDESFATDIAKMVLYVGASRAKHFLEFISVMNTEQLSRMAELICGRNTKNSKMIIGSQLKVKLTL
ncbi:MAG: AAA family ATPase [Sedimentisphaerales bacterium]|nr:AAA family ATPase [Sedimentisphaerales bacterium]